MDQDKYWCCAGSLSALLYIYFLAHILKPIHQETVREDHTNEVFWSELDWVINRDKINLELDPKYADDVTFIRPHISKINKIKRVLSSILEEGNLIENETKREEYHVPSEREQWKSCKCLGSYVDTETDIQHRKGLAISSMRTLHTIFKSRNISTLTTVRILKHMCLAYFYTTASFGLVIKL